MISFLICLVALLVGYAVYGGIVERVFGSDNRPTPAVTMGDGVDYMAMPLWRVCLIQFLNIAGTGPIFGAIMGIWFGPAALLWIVLGCIFAGAVHDYLSGMLSVRNGGESLPGLVGRFLGQPTRRVVLVFCVFLMTIVGAVFVYTPALILEQFGGTMLLWLAVIFVYYILATFMPIDKIIGRFYPFFGVALLFMAIAMMVMLLIRMPHLPEIWDIGNMASWRNGALDASGRDLLGINAFMDKNPLFPCLFVTVACGAISGSHATQNQLMARCLSHERHGRIVFYGSMITEGVVALIWATVASYFFYGGGWQELSGDGGAAFFAQADGENAKTLVQFYPAPGVVVTTCKGWLGIFGGALAMLGVVAAPITSGDTALRSVRLMLAEAFGIDQHKVSHRLLLCVPVFGAVVLLLLWQIGNPDGFNVLWQYFGWSNQTLSVFTLWALTVYLYRSGKTYIITLMPALLMTAVSVTFLIVSPQALGMAGEWSVAIGIGIAAVAAVTFAVWKKR